MLYQLRVGLLWYHRNSLLGRYVIFDEGERYNNDEDNNNHAGGDSRGCFGNHVSRLLNRSGWRGQSFKGNETAAEGDQILESSLQVTFHLPCSLPYQSRTLSVKVMRKMLF